MFSSAMRVRHGKFGAFLVVLLASFSTMPLFQPYFIASSDGLFHLYRLMEYDTVLRQGVWYPRWAPDFFLGLGMPLFNFYAPLTYYLAEVFRLLGAGYIDALKLFVAAIMVVSSLGAYLYARTLLSPFPSLLTAVMYMYAPYHLVNLYYRGDLAEYTAYAWYPFILWAMIRLVERKGFIYLFVGSLSYGALILTHSPSALVFSGFLLVYAMAALVRQRGWPRKQWRPVLSDGARLAGLAIFGAGLATFFWLPALLEKSQVDFDRLLIHFNFHEHFPTLEELLSTSLIHRYGVVFRSAEVYGYKLGALQALFLVLGLVLLVFQYRRLKHGLRVEVIASLLVAALSLFFIFPWSMGIWENAPLLKLTQFPWRFLAFIALPSALLAGMVVEVLSWRWRTLATGLLVPVVIASSVASMFPIMSILREGDISPKGSIEFELTYGAVGTSAAAEYLPIWVKERPATSPIALASVLGEEAWPTFGRIPSGMQVTQLERKPTRITYRVRSPEPGALVLNALYFPGWVAFIDGSETEVSIHDPYGLIKLTVPAGEHTIELRFGETPLQQASDMASAATLLVLLGLLALDLRARRLPPLGWPSLKIHGESLARLGQAGLIVAVAIIWLSGKAAYDSVYSPLGEHKFPLMVDMNEGVSIQGYDLTGGETSGGAAVRVLPGSTLPVSIFWRIANGDATAGFKPFIRLTNSYKQTWAFAESAYQYPETGAQNVITTTLPLTILPGTPPGIYQVEVGFESSSDGELLQPRRVRAVSLLPGEGGARIGPIVVGRSASYVSPRTGLDATSALSAPVNFGDSLRLLDLSVGKASPWASSPMSPVPNTWLVRSGETVHLDLLWQASKALDDNLVVTARIVGRDGTLWAVRDSAPADGTYPTFFWSMGEVVRDQLNLRIPAETPPGQYALELEVVSRRGPLSIINQDHIPVGPTLRMGNISLSPSAKPADLKTVKVQQYVNQALFGGLSIHGYSLGRRELQPGDSLSIEVVWSAARSVPQDLAIRLVLADKSGSPWASLMGRPVGDAYPTPAWREGEILRGRYNLPLSAAVPEGDLELVVQVMDVASGQPLASSKLGRIRVLPRARVFAASPRYPLVKEFDGKIRLLGYEVSSVKGRMDDSVPMASPGDTLKVTPYWQAIEQMSRSYTVFVQILNTSGRLVAQDDSIPQGGKAPTTAWVPGEVVADEHLVPVPASLPEGEYTIITGIYDAATGKRLHLPGGDDFVILTPLSVVAPSTKR